MEDMGFKLEMINALESISKNKTRNCSTYQPNRDNQRNNHF